MEGKREWCLRNAPEYLKGADEELILNMMGWSYERYLKSGMGNTKDKSKVTKVNFVAVEDDLDYMVSVLAQEFGSNLAFKGGYMLSKLITNRARQTSDIDFSILTSELYEDIKQKLEEICCHFIYVGKIDRYRIKETIQLRMSGGVDMYKNNIKVLGVDVGWHDITYGVGSISLDIGSVYAFTVERMLSDKVTSLLTRKRFRRVKDLYDLFIITESFDFNSRLVSDYMIRRDNRIVEEWKNFPFSESVLVELNKAYNKLIVRSVYEGVDLVKPDFHKVIERFNIIARSIQNPTRPNWSSEYKYFR